MVINCGIHSDLEYVAWVSRCSLRKFSSILLWVVVPSRYLAWKVGYLRSLFCILLIATSFCLEILCSFLCKWRRVLYHGVVVVLVTSSCFLDYTIHTRKYFLNNNISIDFIQGLYIYITPSIDWILNLFMRVVRFNTSVFNLGLILPC